jgi:hypothetical protein
MSEIVTIDEATARFPDEWVVLEDPEVDERGVPIRGRLVLHSADRSEAHQGIGKCVSGKSAIFFTGKLSGRYVL